MCFVARHMVAEPPKHHLCPTKIPIFVSYLGVVCGSTHGGGNIKKSSPLNKNTRHVISGCALWLDTWWQNHQKFTSQQKYPFSCHISVWFVARHMVSKASKDQIKGKIDFMSCRLLFCCSMHGIGKPLAKFWPMIGQLLDTFLNGLVCALFLQMKYDENTMKSQNKGIADHPQHTLTRTLRRQLPKPTTKRSWK